MITDSYESLDTKVVLKSVLMRAGADSLDSSDDKHVPRHEAAG